MIKLTIIYLFLSVELPDCPVVSPGVPEVLPDRSVELPERLEELPECPEVVPERPVEVSVPVELAPRPLRPWLVAILSSSPVR
jgi:hypothetical protein